MTASRTDEELMAAYVAGDRSAFDDLFKRYAPLLEPMLRRGLAGSDAADLLQQTFLHLHRGRNDFRPGARLKPWIFTIAINVKRQHLRSLGRRHEAILGDDVDRLVSPEPQPQPDRAALGALLAELPGGQREVIQLRLVEGLSFARIAELVGASVAAVRVRAHRGTVLLRAKASEANEAILKKGRE